MVHSEIYIDLPEFEKLRVQQIAEQTAEDVKYIFDTYCLDQEKAPEVLKNIVSRRAKCPVDCISVSLNDDGYSVSVNIPNSTH